MTLNLPADLQHVEPGIRLGDIAGLSNAIQSKSGASTQNGITASVTQTQAGGTVILYHISRVTTAGSANDAVTLGFPALPGASFVIINDGGNIVGLFPKSGDKINDAATDAVVSLADNTVSKYYCPVAHLWFGGPVTLAT